MKKLTTGKMWCFAVGQLGWSLLSALITNWLVYFYQPDEAGIAAGQTLFIPQGLAVLGIATIIGGIAALGRIFDAVTDPWAKSSIPRSIASRKVTEQRWPVVLMPTRRASSIAAFIVARDTSA